MLLFLWQILAPLLQYGNSSTVYIPSTDNATVNINPNVFHTDCGDVTESTMNCSFNTTSNTTYTGGLSATNTNTTSNTTFTVVLSATNLIGTNSTNVTFDCKLLKVNYPDSMIVHFIAFN